MTIKAGRVSGRTQQGFTPAYRTGFAVSGKCKLSAACSAGRCLQGGACCSRMGHRHSRHQATCPGPLCRGAQSTRRGAQQSGCTRQGLPVSRHRWLVMQAAACPWSPRDSSAESTLSGTKVVAKHTLVPIAPHLQPHNPARQG